MSTLIDQIAARTSSIARTMIRDSLERQQTELELAINATPTGDVRNELCDANIHLHAAISHLNNAGAFAANG